MMLEVTPFPIIARMFPLLDVRFAARSGVHADAPALPDLTSPERSGYGVVDDLFDAGLPSHSWRGAWLTPDAFMNVVRASQCSNGVSRQNPPWSRQIVPD